MRALDVYGDCHSFIVSSFLLFVIPAFLYPSYFLDHLPKMNARFGRPALSNEDARTYGSLYPRKASTWMTCSAWKRCGK
jgi:hypothetical protein